MILPRTARKNSLARRQNAYPEAKETAFVDTLVACYAGASKGPESSPSPRKERRVVTSERPSRRK